MRGLLCVGGSAVIVVALFGCASNGVQPEGRAPVSAQLSDLAPTPDIYTPPAKGQLTVRLVVYQKDEAAGAEDAARAAAEAMARALRDQGIPAFILTRSLPKRGSTTERIPLYYVCAGAFESARDEKAQAVLAALRRLKVQVGGALQTLFQTADFTLLGAGAGGADDDVLAMYDTPLRARFALAVGIFHGPKHKELARAYALRLRSQGQRPLIRDSNVSSVVLIGAVEFANDPALQTLAVQFPQAENDLIGYIAFRGVYQGTDDLQRARAVVYDLRGRGYDAFAERLELASGTPGVRLFESRVYVARKESGNYSLDGLRRAYDDIQPYAVGPAEYRSSIVDLMALGGTVRVQQPGFLTPP
jgi:hypothetical protein